MTGSKRQRVTVGDEMILAYKYGYEALLPETRKTSRLRFPLIESLKIDEVNYD